jgi:hypothetical protein
MSVIAVKNVTHLDVPCHVRTGEKANTDHADKVHTPYRDGREADGGETEQ